jgi:hypothetical protein
MTRTYAGQVGGSDYKRHAVERTEGADTVLQFIDVEGEPELAAYTVSTSSAIALSTANEHLMQIMAGASLRVGIRRIRVYQVAAAASTGLDAFAIYRLTTAGTGGGSITPVALDPADGAAGAAAMTRPTSKGTEGSLVRYRNGLVHATETSIGLNPIVEWDFTMLRTKCLWIAAGTSNGIAVKNLTSDASATVRVEVDLVESEVA